jgi:Acyl-CoA carboxylase epsilon subunit
VSEASTDDTVSLDADSPAEPEFGTESEPGTESQTETHGKSRTSEEDAAVVIAILTALTAGAVPSSGRSGPASVWADPAHMLRSRLSPGKGSWWASGLPR